MMRPTRNGLAFLAMLIFVATVGTMAAAGAAQDDLESEARRHVQYLASDELGGRLTGSLGAELAADYIVAELERLGAKPLPGNDDYRLPFQFTAGVNDGGSQLRIGDAAAWTDAEHVNALSFSDDGTIDAEVVFAGYGLVVPESQGYPYDSYGTLDVEGKVVVVLRFFPEDVDQQARAVLSRYSGLRYKAMQARQRGAAALLLVTGPRSAGAGELVPMAFDTAVAGSGIPAASVSGAVAAALFAASGEDLAEVQEQLDTGNPHVQGFALNVRAGLVTKVEREVHTGYNVVGYFPAREAESTVAKPWVMLGAHYDHLGHGDNGSSLARRDESGQIHNGADDNASGVAAVLAAADSLAQTPLPRNVALAFWSGEELGLVGSSAFVRDEPVAMDRLAAYVNFDMVGRARDNTLTLQAAGSSPVWPRLIERSNVPVGFDITVQDDPYLPTDSAAFNLAEVPTLHFFTGNHEDYHRPSDDAERINYEDLGRIARLGALIGRRIAGLDEPPEFVAVQQSAPSGGDRDSVRVFTGTIPDYATDVEGLLLGGVIEGGPAEAAGLQSGDVIVEIAGQTIANIYDYTFALDVLKIDESVTVVFMRAGERHETTLTPRARS